MLDDTADTATIDAMGTRHRQAFVQALMRVMETDVAERTFAEIIDGLPTIESYQDSHWPQNGHPATQHLEVCPGMIEKARQLRSDHPPTRLKFHLPVSSLHWSPCLSHLIFCLSYCALLKRPLSIHGPSTYDCLSCWLCPFTKSLYTCINKMVPTIHIKTIKSGYTHHTIPVNGMGIDIRRLSAIASMSRLSGIPTGMPIPLDTGLKQRYSVGSSSLTVENQN